MSKQINKRRKIALMKKRGAQCERCGCPLHLRGEQPDWPGSRKAQAHHIISRFAGGSDRQENFVLTCAPCEREYHKKNPEHLWIGAKTDIGDKPNLSLALIGAPQT